MRPEAASVAAALAAFGALMAAALARAGWVFEYPLDDVYIHLAIAEQITRGGYGVNAGELASAGSSPLYPLLLLPFPGTEFQRLLPLMWNIVGLVASAWLWGRNLVVAGLFAPDRAGLGWAAAILGPVAINSFGLAFTGMEHSLHMAASLAVVLGLQQMAEDRQLNAPLLLGIVLSTALRLEGLALGLLAAVVVFRLRGPRAAALCALLAVAPVALFIGTLTALGLDPLPESVQAKLSANDVIQLDPATRVVQNFLINLSYRIGPVLLAGAGVLLALLVLLPSLRPLGRRSLVMAVLLAVVAHLFFGRIGWMDRYEGYIWAVLAAGLMIAVARGPRLLAAAAFAGIVAGGIYAYRVSWTEHFPWNIRAIHLQPAQSARFAKEFAQVPVAVNDLGLVSWNNPDYVLDLWGLASAEARYWRIENPTPGWAGPLARARGVKLAMIYDNWLEEAVGPEWVELGELLIRPANGYLGGPRVTYYATAPEHVPALEAALADWAPTLPPGAVWQGAEAAR